MVKYAYAARSTLEKNWHSTHVALFYVVDVAGGIAGASLPEEFRPGVQAWLERGPCMDRVAGIGASVLQCTALAQPEHKVRGTID